MNTPHHLSALFLLSFLLFFSAVSWSHDHTENQFYVGIKSGFLTSEETNIERSNPIGLQLEYHFHQNFALEIDYLNANFEYGDPAQNINSHSLAAYGVFRTKHTTYFLLKVGIHNELNSPSEINQSATSLSVGVGSGIILTRHYSIESEYTLLDDHQRYIGLSLRYGF
ncbi:MAG: hypothetical protein ACI8O8_002132 [Oleiphilaceae bacterium]